jgi:hypothetical protein
LEPDQASLPCWWALLWKRRHQRAHASLLLEFGIPSRLVGERQTGSHTYFADMNVVRVRPVLILTPVSSRTSRSAACQMVSPGSTPPPGNRMYSPLEPIADCATIYRSVSKQASHNLTEGSCFHEHSFQKDVAIIFIIKICICCVHASQVGIFVNLLSMATASACFVTTQTMRTSPRTSR